MRSLFLRGVAAAWTMIRRLASRLRRRDPAGPRPKPWESSVLDDIVDNRPWNLLLKASRQWARTRLRRDARGEATVVIVNWNTAAETATTIAAVQHFSPPGTRIFIIDNGSRDNSVRIFRDLFPGSRMLALPFNVGHAIALDLGMYLAGTEYAVTLDSDAFPLTHDWLPHLLQPMEDPQVVLVGSASSRGFVHPMYACVRREAFVRQRLSWQPWRVREHDVDALAWGDGRFDTGELMTRQVASSQAVLLERTPNRVEGLPGMTAADAVYHHGGVTRAKDGQAPANSSWDTATAALLPPTVVAVGSLAKQVAAGDSGRGA